MRSPGTREGREERRAWPPAGRGAEAYRVVWGVLFLAAAAFNAVVTIPQARDVVGALAGLSWPGAEILVRELMLPVAAAFIGVVVAFEMLVGTLLLSRGARVRWGLWAALAWLVGLLPFLGIYGLANVVLGAAMIPLLRRRYDRSAREVLAPRRRRPSPVLRPALIGLTLLTGANAIYGGVELIRGGFGLPTSWLRDTPFATWTIPGILLLTMVAVPMLVAAVMLWRRVRGAEAAMVAGATLAAWIIGQMAVVPYFFLQPVMLLAGLGIAGLGFLAVERTTTRPAIPGGNGRRGDDRVRDRAVAAIG